MGERENRGRGSSGDGGDGYWLGARRATGESKWAPSGSRVRGICVFSFFFKFRNAFLKSSKIP
jgi:hypothetical protein